LIVLGLLLLFLALNVRTDIAPAELALKYGGGASRFAMIDGVNVHYRDEGAKDAPPLLLIHGNSSSLHTWDGWVERLVSKHRIVRLDLPGFGLTGPAPDRDYRAARYVRLVTAFLDQLGIDRVDVAGNSLGGRIALMLAIEHPTRVRHLIAIDASGLSGQKPPSIFRLAKTPGLNAFVRWVTPRAIYKKTVEEVYGVPSRVTEVLVDRYYELGRREGNRGALIDRLTGPKDADLDDRLAEIQAPTLILWGQRDAWFPIDFAHRLHERVRGSKLVTYADGGHVPMEELPDATAADAEAFLTAK
jgi:pimeloyl-ACP methyl ester carboxylesterase